MKIKYTAILAIVLSLQVQAQNDITVNRGDLKVSPGTEVSTHFNFVNEQQGNVLNDGEFYFFGNYKNEGLFSYTTNSTTGYVVFEGKMSDVQKIEGTSPSSFYDVLFNKSKAGTAFHLKNDIAAGGTVNMTNGVVLMDKAQGGAFIFLKGAQAINAKDASYVEGEVIKQGKDAFTYPIGKSGYYRLAGISAQANDAESYTGEYFYENPTVKYIQKNKTGIVNTVNDKEYWVINQTKPTNNSMVLTLSWDDRTTPAALTTNAAKDLHIVRWDEKQELWVDEGGIVDFAAKTVTTPVNVEGFGVFTLATIKPPLLHPGDVVIYNGVTPNNDGMNDYFIIDNINYFPNNHVTIYNRWGRKIYATQAYDSKGNVFKGYAEGVDVVGKGEKLPSGTYYYVVEYLYDRDGQNQWVKKVGYLHLDNND